MTGSIEDHAIIGGMQTATNPPEHGVSRAEGIPAVHGGEDVNSAGW